MTPLWPQANGEVERQNRFLLKMIKSAQIEKRNWKEELDSFLIMNRTTPHSTTGVSPAELLFFRKLRTRIPGVEEFSVDDQEVRDRDSEAKKKGKLYANERRCARETDVKEGDTVLTGLEKPVDANFQARAIPCTGQVRQQCSGGITRWCPV